jgi:hypothetical protein
LAYIVSAIMPESSGNYFWQQINFTFNKHFKSLRHKQIQWSIYFSFRWIHREKPTNLFVEKGNKFMEFFFVWTHFIDVRTCCNHRASIRQVERE